MNEEMDNNEQAMLNLLEGVCVLSLDVNLSGLIATRRLCQLGARVNKVVSSSEDPIPRGNPHWYRELNTGLNIIALDIQTEEGFSCLEDLLTETDLLITEFLPTVTEFPGLNRTMLQDKYPQLCQVAILTHSAICVDEPRRAMVDLSPVGLRNNPVMSPSLMAAISTADQVVIEGLAMLVARDRGRGNDYSIVNHSEAPSAK